MGTREHSFHQRFGQGRWFRREVRASAEIGAPIDRVWAVLVDFPRYSTWNPFTPRVRATLEVGTPVQLWVHTNVREDAIQLFGFAS